MNKDGMILLKKPEGVTSFQALNILKRKLNTKKIGHTGTLDKFATGLLVILTGKMTKFAPFITGMDKTYQATFRFGTTTTTLDPEGDFIGEKPIPTLESISKAVEENFSGKVSQVPPDFSAIHIDGKRAYQLKLKGEEVKIPPREIKINYFTIISWDGRDLDVEISCSKGTYIRSIARDLGTLTDSLSYVIKLNRSVVGPFFNKNAVLGEDFSDKDLVSPYNLINGLNRQISFIKDEAVELVKNGKVFSDDFYTSTSMKFKCGEVAIFTESFEFVAMLNIAKEQYKYLFVSSR